MGRSGSRGEPTAPEGLAGLIALGAWRDLEQRYPQPSGLSGGSGVEDGVLTQEPASSHQKFSTLQADGLGLQGSQPRPSSVREFGDSHVGRMWHTSGSPTGNLTPKLLPGEYQRCLRSLHGPETPWSGHAS